MERNCSICSKIIKKGDSYKSVSSRHKTCHKQDRKNRYLNNSETIKKQVREYDKNNPINLKNRRKKYSKTNNGKKKATEYSVRRTMERYHSDPLFRIDRLLRRRLNECIKSKTFRKNSALKDILGCSIAELKTHLEKQFTEGMNWENQGEWHIDHIIPLSRAQNIEEINKLNHYTNLQPLWAADNLKKSNK